MNKQLVKGNDAVVAGALLGGATHFFGYPITPASEIAHGAADLFTRTGRTYLQAEDEVNAINMIYGASSAGARSMTASSGPGISLMAEGLSYLAGAELPAVVVDVQRAGPGLGNIWPEQSDYNAVIKGGGHGNYRNIVLAPASAQEMCDFTCRAFELAERWRMTVFILTDAYIGQIMEPVVYPDRVQHAPRKDWAIYADAASRANLVTSIYMNSKLLSDHNIALNEKYKLIEAELADCEEYYTEDAEFIYVAYGVTARISLSAVQELRRLGYKAGLFRPKTLYPFPAGRLAELAKRVSTLIAVELSNGQMAVDVELAVRCGLPVLRYNWMGGLVPSTGELVDRTVAELKLKGARHA